jgi:4-carboxymuconolactone decarboxylase
MTGTTETTETTRYERGWERLKEVDGTAGERVIASLADICPDLGRYIVEFGFGDIYARPGLSLQQREIATIAALTALGTAPAQLKVHIAAGLHVGLSREEILETIVQMSLYAGFPAALNGVAAAREVFGQPCQRSDDASTMIRPPHSVASSAPNSAPGV